MAKPTRPEKYTLKNKPYTEIHRIIYITASFAFLQIIDS